MGRRKDLSILLRRSAIQRQREAVRLKCDYVGAEHHLMGLLRTEGGNAAMIVRQLGHSIEDLIRAAEKLARPVEDAPTSAEGLPVTFELQRAYRGMNEVAATFGHDTVGTEHLLVGLLSRMPNGKLGPLAAEMAEHGLVREDVEKAVETWSGGREEAA